MRLKKVERGQGIFRFLFPILPLKFGSRCLTWSVP